MRQKENHERTNMDVPVLHFDHWIGHSPQWKAAIMAGLQGNMGLLSAELVRLKGYTPSGANFLHSMYHYATEGQQAFVVGPKLQRMLIDTDATCVPLEFIRAPFTCFYVALAECPISIWGGPTGWHPVGGLYVHVLDADLPGFRVSMWGPENEKSVMVGDDATQWVTLDLSKAVTRTDEDGTKYVNIDEYVSMVFGNANRDHSDWWSFRPEGENKALNIQAAVDLVRLVFNLILYVNSEGADQAKCSGNHARRAQLKQQIKRKSNPAKKRKLQKQLDAISEAKVVWIGKTIETQPEEVSETETSGSRGTVRRHRRRGHWHTYWTGPRKTASGERVKGTNTVLKWIKPRWIGTDIAGLIATRGTHYKFRVEKDG